MDQWWERAACRGAPIELFVYAGSPPPVPHSARVTEALAMCAGCAVRRQCLRDEIEARRTGASSWDYQIRGGLRLWIDRLGPT